MSMLPMYKFCLVCKRRYSWNPSVGKISCPTCEKMALSKTAKVVSKILNKKK